MGYLFVRFRDKNECCSQYRSKTDKLYNIHYIFSYQ